MPESPRDNQDDPSLQDHFGTILFFQKRKFLEFYEDDAWIGCREFDLKLTQRVKMFMVTKHIFTSPSSALMIGVLNGTRPCNAKIHGMSKVDAEHIAHAAVQLNDSYKAIQPYSTLEHGCDHITNIDLALLQILLSLPVQLAPQRTAACTVGGKMERLEGELTRKKVNIFTDIGHRMKRRPFSLQSGKSGGQEGLRLLFAPRSVPYQPEQTRSMNSKVNIAQFHEEGLTGRRDWERELTRFQHFSSEKHLKQKEKTNVSPHTFTTSLPKGPPGKSNVLTQQRPPGLKGPNDFCLSLQASKLDVACSEPLENFPIPSQDQGKGRLPTPLQDEDLVTNYHDNVQINDTLRPFPMDTWEIKPVHHPDVQFSLLNMGSKRVSDQDHGKSPLAILHIEILNKEGSTTTCKLLQVLVITSGDSTCIISHMIRASGPWAEGRNILDYDGWAGSDIIPDGGEWAHVGNM
ncbi:hypothetical protein EDB19DRAFT_1833926 [Suillus lakei]|nr:hypothetical protein EDB19DRAFT_1833926 [Suillus lakei]